jgi:hypothetical protein
LCLTLCFFSVNMMVVVVMVMVLVVVSATYHASTHIYHVPETFLSAQLCQPSQKGVNSTPSQGGWVTEVQTYQTTCCHLYSVTHPCLCTFCHI